MPKNKQTKSVKRATVKSSSPKRVSKAVDKQVSKNQSSHSPGRAPGVQDSITESNVSKEVSMESTTAAAALTKTADAVDQAAEQTTEQLVFDRLMSSKWGLTPDQREALLNRMVEVTLNGKSGLESVKAFQAVMESQKVDLAGLKMILDKKVVDRMGSSGNRDCVPITSLGLDLKGEIDLLKNVRRARGADDTDLASMTDMEDDE